MTIKQKKERTESGIKRGEAHAMNPSVNRDKRASILSRRIRNIRRRLEKKLPWKLSNKLQTKLANYQGELTKLER